MPETPEPRTDQPPVEQGQPADLSEQMRVRLEKRAGLLEAGIPAYPIAVDRTHTLSEIVSAYDAQELGPDHHSGADVSVTGRVIFSRDTGKLCFVRLREGDGTELQAMLSLADLGQESLSNFKAYVDIGDHIGVTGEVVTSRRGELSIRARSWVMAAKALRPLPNEYRSLSDEARVRMRYVDLIVRPAARDMVRKRAAVLRALRSALDAKGYVEVETPVLQLTNGGAAARPFRTRLNAFDQEMLLRIALELDLKKALVGGVDRVYEIGRTFRNEGIDSTHAPEFSMLEAYQAYGDYETMADLLEELVRAAAAAVGVTDVPARDGTTIDLMGPWRHATLYDLVSQVVGEPVSAETSADEARRLAENHQVDIRPEWDVSDILLELYEKLVEHTLITPTFVRDFPAAVKPLAKGHRRDAGVVEAFDLVINGVELAPAYSELNDPVIQRERLSEQSLQVALGNPEAMDLDEDFLRALEFGMPPAGGMGMGIDRLLMLLTGVGIRETILFPLLRRE
jgi:lysyl-tRNA synthetase class 2